MGMSGQCHARPAIYPRGKDLLPVPVRWEAGRAPEPVWTERLEEKSLASAGDRNSIAQSSICNTIFCIYEFCTALTCKQRLFP
jgi:hypothetical protein